MLNRATTFAKHHTPNSVRVVARRWVLDAHNARVRLTTPVTSRCEFPNIYHCTVRKTASQWIKSLLSDPVVYRYSGLLLFDPRPYKWRPPNAVPTGRAVSTLFVSRPAFDKIAKPERYRAFFIVRDPRDIVVSSYFSQRTSHTPMGDIPTVRPILQQRSKQDGLLYMIENLAGKGVFKSLRSWQTAPASDSVRLFRYEDLTGERQAEEVDRLMRHCGITLPSGELEALLTRYSFSNMRRDRQTVGQLSHYRAGKAGDWQNHFDDEVYDAFTAAAGDLVEVLGYPPRDRTPLG
ncbi:MAG TPA: sulfotransferase domain-containing protein [Actinoplanes sp.]|nr:sulfotransferase domain-containing protein [Actinoplanes sp.]